MFWFGLILNIKCRPFCFSPFSPVAPEHKRMKAGVGTLQGNVFSFLIFPYIFCSAVLGVFKPPSSLEKSECSTRNKRVGSTSAPPRPSVIYLFRSVAKINKRGWEALKFNIWK